MPLNRVKLSQYKALAYGPLETLRNLAWRVTGRWSAALAASRACRTNEDHWHFARQNLHPCQKPSEILDFIAWARTRPTPVVVEIGVASGGTSYLLMQCLLSVEHYIGIDFFPRNTAMLRSLGRNDLRIDYIRGASNSPIVFKQLEQRLSGRPIDLLFIDGDHSYAAVKQDWETYRSLVRPGGWIAFHDIRPPELNSKGESTNGFAMDVHRLWAEIRPLAANHEFVANDKVANYGIGAWQNPCA